MEAISRVAQWLFDFLILGGSAAIGFHACLSFAHMPSTHQRTRHFLLWSVVGLSCNMLLIWILFAVDWMYMGHHPPSHATPRERAAAVSLLWASGGGILFSVLGVILAIPSERSATRTVCFWGSCAAIVFWLVSYVALGDIVGIYAVRHP